jgi:hypothetical protein
MVLLPGSPALNVGDRGQLSLPDQRGVNIGGYQASAFVLDAQATVRSSKIMATP